MTKIVHMSDWHGNWRKLPKADVYVCTGDMLDNFPIISPIVTNYQIGWTRKIIPTRESKMQLEAFSLDLDGKTYREYLGNKDAPVVVVRGNHDFVDLGPLFGGDVFEIQDPTESTEICGLTFGGFRGINELIREWSDEKNDSELEAIVSKLPNDLDVIVTHAPPSGILDKCYEERCGVRAFTRWINEIVYEDKKKPKLFCFGHIHEGHGTEEHDGMIFSNAATTYHKLEIE